MGMYAELFPVVWLCYDVENLFLEGSMFADPSYFLRFHEYAIFIQFAFIGRLRVIECE